MATVAKPQDPNFLRQSRLPLHCSAVLLIFTEIKTRSTNHLNTIIYQLINDFSRDTKQIIGHSRIFSHYIWTIHTAAAWWRRKEQKRKAVMIRSKDKDKRVQLCWTWFLCWLGFCSFLLLGLMYIFPATPVDSTDFRRSIRNSCTCRK